MGHGRGSVCTWQDYGRRSSNMQQFSSSRTEFMTSDDLEYKRDDGWFLSYPKLAAVIVVFIIGVVAAGFLGWYINFLQNTKSSDTPDLDSDEIDENEIVDITISPFIHPLRYHLELTPVFDGNAVSKLEGRVVIEFQVEGTPSLSKLFLNAKNITVTGYNLTVNQEVKMESDGNDVYPISNEGVDRLKNATRSEWLQLDAVEIKISRYDIDEEKELHTIELDEAIVEGNYSLGIGYEVSLDPDAFYAANFSQSDGEKWLIGTRLKSFSAGSLLPVFGDARSKSVLSVSMARPKEMRVLSNMPRRTSRDSAGNMVMDMFAETPLLSSSNLALVLGHVEPLHSTTQNGYVAATFWGDPESHSRGIYLAGKLVPVVINLIDIFSMPYPLPKLDFLGLPLSMDENIGKPGLISLKQSIFRADEQSAQVTKNEALRDLVYLLGQQWLGGIVNMNWTDAWILNGILRYLQYDLAEKIDSSLNSSNSFVVDVQIASMEVDGYSNSRSLEANANNFFEGAFNNRDGKGACLIRMLHGALNSTVFRHSYQKFVERWKYDTAGAEDFWNIMAEEANGLPLVELMTPWISQGGYPVVVITRDYEKGSALIRQERFTYDGSSDAADTLWHIPLTYVSDGGNWSDPEVIWFQSEPEISLKEAWGNGSWILFNINKTGYYRVHYDEQNWMLLKAALEENHELFPPETKASLIDDVFALAAVGLAKYETAFEFIKYMQMKERHYAPWAALMRQVFKLNRLLYETPAFTSFQEFMLKFISPLYEELKLLVEDGTQLPLIAVKIACAFEHPECLDWFKTIFNNVNPNLDIASFMPAYIHDTFYCTIARYGTRKEWNYFIERAAVIVDGEEKKHLLSAFSCFQAPWVLQTVLNEALYGKLFTNDEVSTILSTFPQNPAAAQASFKFVRANWPEIVEKHSKSYTLLKSFAYSMFNGITTPDDIEDLQEFRQNNNHIMRGAHHATFMIEANAKFVQTWMKNCLPEVERLLELDIRNDTAKY